MRLTIIGTGYVGLVTGTCFAEMGNDVTCIDINKAKLAQLRQGVIPIHEPGLETLVNNNLRAGRLTFSDNLVNAVNQSEVMVLNRMGNDGDVLLIRQAGSTEGTISVSGSTVTYGGFSGQHESSGIATDTPVGTVVSTIDELDTYPTGTTKAAEFSIKSTVQFVSFVNVPL